MSLQEQVIEWFCAAWEAQYGRAYHVTAGDRSQMGRFLNPGGGKTMPRALVDELPVVFAAYCASDDKFEGEKLRHSLKYFCTSGAFNKYRTVAATAGYSDKELRGRAAGAEWVAEMNGRGR